MKWRILGSILSLWLDCVSAATQPGNLHTERMKESMAQLEQVMKTAAAESKPAIFPRSVMSNRPALNHVKLSPDGQRVAYTMSKAKYRQIWIYDVAADSHNKAYSTKQLNNIFWSADSQDIYVVTNDAVSLFPVTKSSTPKILYKFENEEERFIRVADNLSSAFYVAQAKQKTSDYHLLRIDRIGQRELLLTSKSMVKDFLTNANGELKVIKQFEENQFQISAQTQRQGQWQTIISCEKLDPCDLQALDESNNRLYLNAYLDGNFYGLFTVSLSTKQHTRIHQDPSQFFDLEQVWFDQETKQPVMTMYRDDYRSYYGLEPKTANVIDAITKQLESKNALLQPDKSFNTWLVIDANPDKSYPDLYVFDAEKPMKKAILKAQSRQSQNHGVKLQSLPVAPRLPIYYQVSDGMVQQGYVTLPLGRDLRKVPLVIHPHGGPWARDFGSYSMTSQFLANRGYAVFQPNFRSSTGFGKDYMFSANRDFGDGRVQQDIIDGMHFILELGIGDPENVAMFGHSFGGFATLSALSFTPEQFKVGIAGAPPIDLVKAIRNFKPNRSDNYNVREQVFKQLAVDLTDENDIERMQSRSPDRHWQKVNKPLYIIAGERDDRVSILNLRDYASRLEANEHPISFLSDKKEGHSPRHPIAREAYFYIVEYALAKHLNGVIPQAPSSNLSLYLKRNMVFDHFDLSAH